MTEQAEPGVVVDDQGEDRGPRVVVGVDFSAGARAALLFALHDAVRRGVPVEAVTAYRPPDYWMDFYAIATYHPDQIRTGALDRLRTFVAEVLPDGPQPPPPVRVHAAMGVGVRRPDHGIARRRPARRRQPRSRRVHQHAARLGEHALRDARVLPGDRRPLAGGPPAAAAPAPEQGGCIGRLTGSGRGVPHRRAAGER